MTDSTSNLASGPWKMVKNFIQSWDKFWFAPADPTRLGFMRIICGMVVLFIHVVYTQDLQEFMGKNAWIDLTSINEHRLEQPWLVMSWDWNAAPQHPPAANKEERDYLLKWWGANPRNAWAKGYPAWSIWFEVTDPTWMMIIHCSFLAVFFCFMIGFCTRVTSVLAWVAAISYIQRSPTTIFGMDTMMNILLIYLMIGPSGAALSVDRLLSRWWAVREARRHHLPVPQWSRPAPQVSANVALRLLQIHLCCIYMASGLSKLQGTPWWNGTAVWATMAVYEYCPMQIGSYGAFLQFLCAHRWLWELTMSSGVVFTLFTEIGFPFLVWNRKLRWPMITLALMLHTGIALVMGLRTFSLLMYAMLIAFVPQETVDRIRGRLEEWVPSILPHAEMKEDALANSRGGSIAARNPAKVAF
jgi:hypothetical protein